MPVINFGLFRSDGHHDHILVAPLDSVPRIGEHVTIGGNLHIVRSVTHDVGQNHVDVLVERK